MIICKTVDYLNISLQKEKKDASIVGFVPTMGALHKGHISLINLCKQQSTITVCSIFVNPTQFNDPKDFEKYPITIEQDILQLEQAGCDILFLPSVNEIYPAGTQTSKNYNLGFIETVLEGSARLGHFQGVCQVVDRLLNIVQPNLLFLGQKDYQQCMVINKMLELINQKDKIQLVVGATLRETSGLAMSSRNVRLSDSDKQKATAIYQSLNYIQQHIGDIPISTLQQNTKNDLLQVGFEKVDYVAICDAKTLAPITVFEKDTKLVALIAAFIGGVRLIDNISLN
jgi:pantoate--beta-alanine ligase